MKKLKLEQYINWLYLLPLLICIIFLHLFTALEEKANSGAFDEIVAEKHSFFNKILRMAPLFQSDDAFFLKLAAGLTEPHEAEKYAFMPYTEVVQEMLNDAYTLAIIDVDSVTLTREYPRLKAICLTDTVISYYEKGRGNVKLFLYKLGPDNFWLFGVTDGDMVRKQNQALSVLVVILLTITALINMVLLYIINKQMMLAGRFSKAARLCIEKTKFDDD